MTRMALFDVRRDAAFRLQLMPWDGSSTGTRVPWMWALFNAPRTAKRQRDKNGIRRDPEFFGGGDSLPKAHSFSAVRNVAYWALRVT